MRIDFYVRFFTHFGQAIFLKGNIDNLGKFETEGLPLSYFNRDFWHASIDIDAENLKEIRYKYALKNVDGTFVDEGGDDRVIDLSKISGNLIETIDTWNFAGEFENAFYTIPFRETLLPSHPIAAKARTPKKFSHIFRIKAPLLQKHEAVCISGSGSALGDWDQSKVTVFKMHGNWWEAKIDLPKEDLPVTYKYAVFDIREKKITRFENGANRSLHGDAADKLTIIHDGFINLPNNTWRGAGVAIPVFSLRSKKSFGVGEFLDIKLLVDWAKSIGLKLIQLLPVNDTIATNTWLDSYPYAAISAFALHPIYIHLEQVANHKHGHILKPLKKVQGVLNDLNAVDYEQVMKYKLSIMKVLYFAEKEAFLKDEDFKKFFEEHKEWLVPYAAFSYLRDLNGTANFALWKKHAVYDKAAIDKFVSPRNKHYDEIATWYFIQYHLHLQLKEAAEYAHKHGIIMKGDIPIGVYRYSCDAWVEPALYNLDMQAGAPPDPFAMSGQNWGLPTYNWSKMAEDHYDWWHRRFDQMTTYYDAFRIDHILGFFRIWSVPVESIEGIMGHFVPAIPIHSNEFTERNIWFDYNRYTKPFINDYVLGIEFGNNAQHVKDTFLRSTGVDTFELREEFNTQRKVANHFAKQESNDHNDALKQGLFNLISNVILFEVPGSNRSQFHFRIAMEGITSYQQLEWHTQQQLKDLSVNYFYYRQEDFWKKESLKKLPALKASTGMLICGEDLGMVPACVPDVMKQLGILSLEIQRMPKSLSQEFFHPASAPYLSVCMPSTHDMSTIRGWWEEDRARTQRFFNYQLQQWGDAPLFCEPWINKAIILQHLHSPAMWSIFQIQDLFGIDGDLRTEDVAAERINDPANPRNYWRYRMHITLEQLMKEKAFNHELKENVKASGRSN
jgi:4-alpha-glucanotransferase